MAATANTISSERSSIASGRGLLSRIISSALAFGIGLLLIDLGVPRFQAAIARLPADATMGKIREGGAPSTSELAIAAKAAENSSRQVAEPEVVATLGRLRLALALARGVNTEFGRRELSDSETATRNAIALSPASPFEWLQLSYVTLLAGKGGSAALPPLRMSFETGQYTKQLVLRRLDYALTLWSALDSSARDEVADQIRIVAAAYPSYLAILAWHHHRIGEMRSILAEQPRLLADFEKYLVWQGPRSYDDAKDLIFAH